MNLLLIGALFLVMACQNAGDTEESQNGELPEEGEMIRVAPKQPVLGFSSWALSAVEIEGAAAEVDPSWNIRLRNYETRISVGNCQPFSGIVAKSESGELTFSELALSTNRSRNDCDPKQAVLERKLLDLLQATSTIALTDSTLVVTGAGGQATFLRK